MARGAQLDRESTPTITLEVTACDTPKGGISQRKTTVIVRFYRLFFFFFFSTVIVRFYKLFFFFFFFFFLYNGVLIEIFRKS